MTPPPPALRTRLTGLVAALVLLAFVVGAPLILLAIDAVPSSSDFTWSRLTSPDDGTLAVAVITVVAWVAWAIFTISVVVDIAARVRGIRAPRLPGLAVPQLAAGRLVSSAALLFISVPAVTALAAVATAPRAHAAAIPVAQVAPATPAVDTTPQAAAEPPTHGRETEPYTVKRGDSLWKIAEERLGDGTKYVELLDLNRSVLGEHPDFLVPGTILRVPAAEAHDEAYVVHAGDTLSQIAEDELGEATDYQEIFDASRATVQPDGEHLTDPDLIRTGWHLTIPDSDRSPDPPKRRHGAAASTGPTTAPPIAVTPPQTPPPQTPPTQPASADVGASAVASDAGLPTWVLPGLATGGAALAGCLLLVLRRHRRAQLRYRTPGHVIAPPPEDLRTAEKSIQVSGSVTAPRIDVLDRALRTLPDTVPLRVVTLSDTTIDLTLASPAALEAPWTGTGMNWSIGLADVAGQEETSAPFPLLASVGQRTDGTLVLVNLEQLGTISIQGDPDQAAALVRHLIVELATAPWARLTEIDTLGLGIDLAPLDPARVRIHADGDTAFLSRISEELRDSDPDCSPDRFRAVLLADAPSSDAEEANGLAKAITTYPGRRAVALIGFAPATASREFLFHVAADGTLTQPHLDLNVRSAGLTVDEAIACARLIDLTREAAPSPVPAPADGDDVADAAGALTTRLTQSRPSEAAVARSVLPAPALVYADRAAVTAGEVDLIAPQATEGAHQAVVESDPDLDEDLARWESPVPVAPKLTLLGPVTARVLGDPSRGAQRRPYFIELLAYLDLHPHGVTSERLAEELGIREKKARDDLSNLRHWLGIDSRTGQPFLPAARKSGTKGEKAPYFVQHVLCDLDLFRRLRARGHSRGAEGLDDLVAALHLVSGEPFTDLRAHGWGWLLEGERLDEIMRTAIVDVGHLVTTRALGETDLELAQFASRVALAAGPYDETARLDMVAVATALGDSERASELLRETILERSDDAFGPIEPPERTARIIKDKGWVAPRQRRTG